jgi:hypothetical protein
MEHSREHLQERSFKSVVGERLSLAAFQQLAGTLAGYRFCKLVVDRQNSKIHFINNNCYKFHADYIAEELLHMSAEELEKDIDKYNQMFYADMDRRFYLGIIALHARDDRQFFSLETVEIDTMNEEMLKYLYKFVQENLDPTFPLLLKPANHFQEKMMSEIEPASIPHIFSHELFATKEFVNLNPGKSSGRLRVFIDEREYQQKRASIEWYDIVVMNKVPDDIPRVSGIINAEHTTPLSHTNVLASGWQIPNCIQLGVMDRIRSRRLDGKWVEYSVGVDATELELNEIARPLDIDKKPSWTSVKITLEEPETVFTKIMNLKDLRRSDRFKFGTKAANLGELHYVLSRGSDRLTAFYRIPRPPRANLLSYLARFLGRSEDADLNLVANRFLQESIRIPRGIALPFSVQQEFLESSPKIQQSIGKLKMALELNERQVDSLCISLQQLIRSTRMPDRIRDYIDSEIANNLAGVSSFVIRSSSNAEDLGQFSAAGIYESINHVTTAENIFESIKKVWASLVSARSIRLRQDVGISLDDCYMGVVIQEEVKSEMGGVLVTTNPMSRADFRNVYLNVSTRSVNTIVDGTELPYQYLFNTVEGGGRTLSIGSAAKDLSDDQKGILQNLTFAGRLLQSHFSPDYTFSSPVDIEWIAGQDGIHILQLRPYCG